WTSCRTKTRSTGHASPRSRLASRRSESGGNGDRAAAPRGHKRRVGQSRIRLCRDVSGACGLLGRRKTVLGSNRHASGRDRLRWVGELEYHRVLLRFCPDASAAEVREEGARHLLVEQGVLTAAAVSQDDDGPRTVSLLFVLKGLRVSRGELGYDLQYRLQVQMLEHERRECSIDVRSRPSAQVSHLVLGAELDNS